MDTNYEALINWVHEDFDLGPDDRTFHPCDVRCIVQDGELIEPCQPCAEAFGEEVARDMAEDMAEDIALARRYGW